MQRAQAASLGWTARFIDAMVVTLTFLGVAWLRQRARELWSFDVVPGEAILAPVTVKSQFHLVFGVVPVWLASLSQHRLYDDIRRIRADVLLLRIASAVAVALALLLLILFLFPPPAPTSRSFLILFAVASVFTIYAARRWEADRARKQAPTWNILVVGSAAEAAPFVDTVLRHPQWALRVSGVVVPEGEEATSVHGVRVLGRVPQLRDVIDHENIAQVFMTGRAWDTSTLRVVGDTCEEVGVTFSMDANFLGLSIAQADVSDLGGWSVISFSSTPSDGGALLVKRTIDVAGAAVGLLVLGPLMLAVAALIKLGDGGPVLFVQDRSGLYGRTFPMYKFRSMVVDAEKHKSALEQHNEMSGPVFKMQRDPRITRIGALIRKTSIDELPQLWNVLRGEMSVVGPRPPLPSEVARYERWQMRRLSMKPGLTCIWQVSGRNRVDFDNWMRLDLEYIDNWSLFLDVKLILQTFPVVITGRGAS
ncbi:MAG: sugar transferase [Deltaproteobacteria bacterium]|nr:sugar transferase [Deltaproteobacteria bacterium]